MCGVEVENIMFDRSESNGNYLEHNKRVSMFITFNTVPFFLYQFDLLLSQSALKRTISLQADCRFIASGRIKIPCQASEN